MCIFLCHNPIQFFRFKLNSVSKKKFSTSLMTSEFLKERKHRRKVNRVQILKVGTLCLKSRQFRYRQFFIKSDLLIFHASVSFVDEANFQNVK